ncbi:MAG: helix-turn-helix domain-containing protein [Flavobacteriales bacterium]
MQKKKSYLIIFLFYSFSILAQDFSAQYLNKLNEEQLENLFLEVKLDFTKAKKVANEILKRAEEQKDTLKIVKGYEYLSKISIGKKSLQYADSIISYTKNINTQKYPSYGYLLKAREYNNNGNIKEATENFLKAYKLSLKNKNLDYQLFALGRLIFLKSIWGDKKEALELQRKRHAIIKSLIYNKDITSKDEITSLFNFSFCYLNLRELDSAEIYAKKGLKKIGNYHKENSKLMPVFFKEILIEINYYKKNYNYCVKSADSLLSKINYQNNIESFQNLYFFKGLALLKTNKYDEGIFNLIKSDSVFEKEKLQIKQPYQRELFELLFIHYKFKKNYRKQIKYLNKLIKADSIIIENYQFFEPNLIKKFETPKLIKEKEKLIASLRKKSITLWLMIGLLGISILILMYYIRMQNLYKKRFNAMILNKEFQDDNDIRKYKKKELSKEVINNILVQLEVFEKNKDYLFSDLNIQKLAKKFGTNHKYLSKVINLQKEKHFSHYINDLRINYIYQRLKTDSKLRNYTIKAIANECGFNSAEYFSKAFYKKFGIYPSFYIKQLKKTNKI